DRGEKRLIKHKLNPQVETVFHALSDEGFTQNGINFLKELATVIYKENKGHPVVEYAHSRDGGSWKETFFGPHPRTQLLREACPFTRNGNQYRFNHKSLLE